VKRLILNEVFAQQPIGSLYHYTNQKGFRGIIGEKEIWATHTQYLNDTQEFKHACQLVHSEIHEMLTADPIEPKRKRFLEQMKGDLLENEKINVCVCSFSEERNSLSQWRAYGGSQSGFAIGFTGDFLVEVARNAEWYFALCVYEPGKQREIIRALIEEVLEENIARKEVDWEYMPPGGNLGAYLNRYAPVLKESIFHEEKEWRLISRPLSCNFPKFDFREGSSMLIPFYKLPLKNRHSKFILHEVIIGPTLNPEQSLMSAKSFLVRQGLKNVAVEPSHVPYRSII